MVRFTLFTLLLAAGVACSSGRSTVSNAANAANAAKPAEPAKPAETADSSTASTPAAAPCDFKIVAMADPSQKQIQCANGDSFVLRRGEDNKWYEEMRVRAGTRPGYATPDEAGRARCCAPAAG